MFRNDRGITPLRLKQAIDSRFIELDNESSLVLIDGKWIEFHKLPPVVDCAELLTMYSGDTTLTETPLINATGCTSLREAFWGCTRLVSVKYIHMPNVTNMYATFARCASLTTFPVLDTITVRNMTEMFAHCTSLKTVQGLDVSSATYMSNMFNGCSRLTSVTFTGDNVPPHGTSMFSGTPIASGTGYIFVPNELVDEYKNANGWSAYYYRFRGISVKEGLQSNINSINLMIEENPTMFKLTDEEQEELEKD